MITAVNLGNFKAFAETQRVPIRPLTLIYGANSAGKSSIIHSLILARHALETGDLNVHHTNIGGDSVDLGGFRQYVHRRDVSQQMEWSAEISTKNFKGHVAELFASTQKVILSVQIGLSQIEVTKEQESVDPRTGKKILIKVPTGKLISSGLPEIMVYSLSADNRLLLQMSKRRDGNFYLDRLDHEHPFFQKLLKAIIETSTTAESIQPSDYDGLSDAISSLVPEIIAGKGNLFPQGLIRAEAFSSGGQNTLFPVSKGRRQEDIIAAVRFIIPRSLDEIIKGVSESVNAELLRFRYLGPLRSYPPRHLAFSQHHDPNWFAGGGYAWDVVRRDSRVRELINTWLAAPNRLQTRYELVIRELIGIDQLENPVWDGLEHLNEDGLSVEPDYDNKPEPEGAYPTIKDIGKEVARMVDIIRSSEIDKLNELIMIDRSRSNTIVSHRDVGIGVSQVLPVLVEAYASKGQIIAIEQPEIHLHPALQADLGDVFLQSALGEGKNRFIIETHSEHLLLRIMRRMRETATGKLSNVSLAVSPNDVMVLYVEADGSRSIIREIPLNEHGELVKAWPGGFFEEGLREVF